MEKRLQFVHHDEIFQTKEEAINYVVENQGYNRPSLYAEPMVLKYGDSNDPNIILAIGSLGDGVTQGSNNNRTFFIDINGITTDIEEIEAEIEELIDIVKIVTKESETLSLYVEQNEGGSLLSGDVKLNDTVVINRQEVDSIIKKNDNGLYAYVNLTFDDETNTFTFQVNSEVTSFTIPVIENVKYDKNDETLKFTYTDGIVLSASMKDLIEEWETSDGNKSYQEYLDERGFSSTPVLLYRDRKLSDEKDMLFGDINILSTPDNILSKTQDGQYLYVDGKASNISYWKNGQKTTVKDVLDSFDGKSKVSDSDDNIIYNQYDIDGTYKGIASNVSLNYDKDSNKLTFSTSLSNGGSTAYTYQLNSVSFIEDITFNPVTEVLTIRYKDSNGNIQRVDIDMGEIIDEWIVNNDSHSVKLVKQRQVPGKDILTADVKIFAKDTVNNNILEEISHELVVRGFAWNIKYTQNETVEEAINRLGESESDLERQIEEEAERAIVAENAISGAVDTLAEKVDNEIERSTTKDDEIEGQIQELSGAIATNTFVTEDTDSIDLTLTTVEGNPNILKADINISTEDGNIIILDDSASKKGIYAKAELSYDSTTNVLTFTNTNGETAIQLETVSGIKSITYDKNTEILTITYIVTGGGEKTVEINMGDLITEWETNPVNTDGNAFASGMTLVKSRSIEGTDVLTAAINVSRKSDNIFEIDDTGRAYVSNQGIEDNKTLIEKVIESDGLKENGEYSANTESNYIKLATSLTDADDKLDAQIKANADSIDELAEEVEASKVGVDSTNTIKLTMGLDNDGINVIRGNVKVSAKDGNVIKINNDDADGIYATVNLDYDDNQHKLTLTTSNGVPTSVTLSDLSNEIDVDNNNHNVTMGIERGERTILSSDVNIAPTSNPQYADNILQEAELVTGKALYVSGAKIDENASKIAELSGNVDSAVETLETAIREEAERAVGAETALQTSISSEVERAMGSESTISTALNNEVTRAISAETALNTAITTESTLRASEIANVREAVSAETAARVNKDTELENDIASEQSARESADTTLANNITTETANRTSEDALLRNQITTETASRTAEDSRLSDLIAANTTAISTESERARGAETTLSTLITEVRSDISDVSSTLQDKIDAEEAARIADISRVEQEIEEAASGAVITVSDTNTVSMVKDASNVISSVVKIDGNTVGNIISEHTDGIYASANLTYNPATNTLTWSSTNGSVDIPLNAGSIITGIYYDAPNKKLIITYNIETSTGTTTASTDVDVTELFNPVDVQSGNHLGGIQLTSYTDVDGSTIISAGTVISTDVNNILVNDNGVLKVIGTADNIKYNSSTVGDSLTELYSLISQETTERENKDNEIEREISAITSSTGSLQEELDRTQVGAGLNPDGTYAPNVASTYINSATSLNNADALLDAAVAATNARVDGVVADVASLSGKSDSLQEELDRTQVGAGLNSDGVYEPNLLANYISGATSLKNADELLDGEIKNVNDKLDKLSQGNSTYSTTTSIDNDGSMKVDVKLSHAYSQTEDIENVEVDNASDISINNLLKIIHVKDSIKEAKTNGLYFDGSVDYGEF